MILEGRDLAIGYRGRRVGEGLNIALGAGRILALLGPNGCGKTTLLKTLLGLIPPLAGDVRLANRPLGELSARERARLVAYVPQVHAGTFGFTVDEVVLMGRTAHSSAFARPSAADEAVATAAIDRLRIGHLRRQPYTMISGGERQLALIARALTQEPSVVVLDEPTASLDFGNQGRVLGEMRDLAASGLAVLFTTHDPNQALRYADDVLMIREGRVLIGGPADQTVTRERLQELYGTRITEVESSGVRAFLPG